MGALNSKFLSGRIDIRTPRTKVEHGTSSFVTRSWGWVPSRLISSLATKRGTKMNMRLCAALRLGPHLRYATGPLTLTFSRPTTFSFLGNHLPLTWTSYPLTATYLYQSISLLSKMRSHSTFSQPAAFERDAKVSRGPKLEDVQLGRAFAKTKRFISVAICSGLGG